MDKPRGVQGAPTPARRAAWWNLPRRHRPLYRGLVSIVGGLLLWEFVGRFVVDDPIFFVPFSSVVAALRDLATTGNLAYHLSVSGIEYTAGFLLAAVIGVPVGILLGANQGLREYADPWVSAFYATPLVALTPFFILVFGIGLESKIALVFVVAVFPALINTAAGVRAIDRSYLEVAAAFQLSSRQRFTKVLVPASLPFIVSGLRLAAGRGLIGVVVGELFFSSGGVGHVMSRASQTFDTATVLAGVLIFAVAGVLVFELLRALERRLSPWRVEL
jgi:NitT/TauT family transport system permease protein